MTAYLYRRGNGNDGNYIRALVRIDNPDDTWNGLRALLANDYIPGRKVRRWIMRNVEIDGEPEFGLQATVLEGPDGETEFGAAYITAALEPLKPEEEAYYRDTALPCYDTLHAALDRGAREWFTKLQNGGVA